MVEDAHLPIMHQETCDTLLKMLRTKKEREYYQKNTGVARPGILKIILKASSRKHLS
jgi:hypothetical protein